MMGQILVDRDVRQIPASRENSVSSGQTSKRKKREREKQTLQFGSGVKVSGIQWESRTRKGKALNTRV